MALAAKNPAGYGKHSRGAAATVRRGRNGATVQGDGDRAAPAWPDVAGLEVMSVAYRTATVRDAEALAELGIATFTDTFGHLYQPDDLRDLPPEPFD